MLFLRWFALLLLGMGPVSGEAIALSKIGDSWKYLAGTSEPSTQPGAWLQPGFDDHLWRTGRSGFSAGYASGEVTSLPEPTPPYVSAYFRRTFLLTDPAQIQWLTLRLDYADGFIAYLNGQEIARRNLDGPPGVLVPFARLAKNIHDCGQPEEINVSGLVTALVAGTNCLAVQLHNALPTSAGLCVSPELMANFNRAPYLQNMTSNQVQIIWKTPVLADTQIDFGPSPDLGFTMIDTNLSTTHVATLTNLAPNSSYFYRVHSSDGERMASSDVATFHTFKMAGAVSFMALGDGGWNSLAEYQLADVIRTNHPDFVIEVGDIVYPSFTSALVDARCFSVYQPHMGTTPYFFALGNHDLYSGVTNYLEAFYLPTNSVPLATHALAQTSPEHYYSFDQGDAHVTVLFVPFAYQSKLTVGDPQYQWLTNDLASTQQPWKIAICHVPMSSSSAHRFDDSDGNGIYDRLEIRNVLLPVLSRYGVQLVLSGHEHGYERFNPTNGVHAITTAGGGVPLYSFTELDVASALFWPRYNCVKISIDGDTLLAQALGIDGDVFDSMTIQRRPPAPKVFQAAWHTPVMATGPANDGDGNVFGQFFDFQGEPILSLSGQFSNLGRTYVNNDQTNLYVGLEQVMIYGNNNIFLFIESPRLPGVAGLSGLGNGLVDPDKQGADGLDFLENLSFTDFQPAIGAILGDEFGDGQFRSFARTNLSLNIGQGVFRLDPALSDVSDVHLQQFHLSPQIGGAQGEENANFIQLAIPLRELGHLLPGDIIRIAAVVGGADFDTSNQTRLLDSGFLGSQMTGAGFNAVALSGVPVRLAFSPDSDQDGDGLTRAQELLLGTDPARPDSDGDGLPDGWEVAHGLDPMSALGDAGADGDPDLDSATNLSEFLAGTDPRNPDSALRLSLPASLPRTLEIAWPAAAGRQYQLESSDSPSFIDPAATDFPISTVATSFSYRLDLDSATPAARFYRVRIVQ